MRADAADPNFGFLGLDLLFLEERLAILFMPVLFVPSPLLCAVGFCHPEHLFQVCAPVSPNRGKTCSTLPDHGVNLTGEWTLGGDMLDEELLVSNAPIVH